MESAQIMEIVKYLGGLAVGLTAVLGISGQWANAQKSKNEINPNLAQTMLDAISDDSRARRGYMESLSHVQISLANNMAKIAENHHDSHVKTETLHALTRNHIGGLKESVSEDLKAIQSNQIMLNNTVKQGLRELKTL